MFRYFWWVFLALPVSAWGQGRSIFNSDFEFPSVDSVSPPASVGAVGSWGLYHEDYVPFWQTTASDQLIEIGKSATLGGPYGFDAQSGVQMAELNGSQASNLFFDVCLFDGEEIDWSLWHRGRGGEDSMGIVITEPNGNDLPLIKVGTPNTLWQQVTGAYVNATGMNGNLRFTFHAISTASGNLTIGNMMDNVTIMGLAPLVEFVQPAYADSEFVAPLNPPQIRVNGLVGSSGATLTFAVKGGSATSGIDYDLPATLVIPAGNYFNTVFDLPFTVDDDDVPEGDETIFYALTAAQANDPAELDPLIRNTSCGLVTHDTITYTLFDVDVPMSVSGMQLYARAQCSGNQLEVQVDSRQAYLLEYHVPGEGWQSLAALEGAYYYTYAHAARTPLTHYRLVHYDGRKTTTQAVYNVCQDVHMTTARYLPAQQLLEATYYAPAGLSQLRILDMMGKEMYTQTVVHPQAVQATTRLELPQLARGIYLFQVVTDQGSRVLQFLVN
ncbi:MAG: hypothetical protein KF690_01355 [Bacteroidetes bacterium]|nr:hypothetical protein [Bacteroidota bacterium]